MSKPENPPAFPTEWSPGLVPGEAMQTGEHTAQFPGMTLRDWFAGQALAATWAWSVETTHDVSPAGCAASCAYEVADAMLAEREK